MTHSLHYLKRLPFYLVALLFLGACDNSKPSVETGVGASQHFDLKGYIDGEVQRLGMKGKARKLVVAEGKEESKIMDSVDFNRELDIFSMSDINRPAWSDYYIADSNFNDKKQLVHLEIKSLDKTLKTQRIGIDYQNGVVSKIHVQNNAASPIASSYQILTYEPAYGYSIESHQRVTFAGVRTFKTQVQFLD